MSSLPLARAVREVGWLMAEGAVLTGLSTGHAAALLPEVRSHLNLRRQVRRETADGIRSVEQHLRVEARG